MFYETIILGHNELKSLHLKHSFVHLYTCIAIYFFSGMIFDSQPFSYLFCIDLFLPMHWLMFVLPCNACSFQFYNAVNTLRPTQHGCHFAADIFKCIFLNENVLISIKISLKFVSKVPINNIPALVQIMAWRRPGDKPLSEPMVVSLLTHICVTRPEWVNQ